MVQQIILAAWITKCIVKQVIQRTFDTVLDFFIHQLNIGGSRLFIDLVTHSIGVISNIVQKLWLIIYADKQLDFSLFHIRFLCLQLHQVYQLRVAITTPDIAVVGKGFPDFRPGLVEILGFIPADSPPGLLFQVRKATLKVKVIQRMKEQHHKKNINRVHLDSMFIIVIAYMS